MNSHSSKFEGFKKTYDCQKDCWDEQNIVLRVHAEPFAQGGMRLAYRAREVLDDGSEMECVLKRMRTEMQAHRRAIYKEAMTQMVAEGLAQDFNKTCYSKGLPHRIAFLPVSVVEVRGGTEAFTLEPYLPGEYVKHSDNYGHNETEDEIAAAFSYFTYVNSNSLLVVCDIQGVGTFYTDPQIHTFDGEGFGEGNLGPDGIQRFLRSHVHSLLCEKLGLPSLDEGLTDEELAQKFQEKEQLDAMECVSDDLAPFGWSRQQLHRQQPPAGMLRFLKGH